MYHEIMAHFGDASGVGCEHPENGQLIGMPYFQSNLAEGKGFEPPEPCGSSDFESDAIDHWESISAF